jgi:O-antigen/teichoic acid export membrane protein
VNYINTLKQKYLQNDIKNKRLIYNTIFSFTLKGLGVVISLFLMPSYMRFFPEKQVLGLWFTALSVLSWVLVFDLGVGNGLRNKLVEAFAKDDKVSAKKYISSAYIMVGVTVFIITIVGYFIFYFINWNVIFNVSESLIPKGVLTYVIRIIFVGIMLQFFLKLITSVMYSLQKPALPGLLSLVSTILLIIFLFFSKNDSLVNNLIKLSYANVLTANLPILIATLFLFYKKLRYCIPSFASYDSRFAKNILKLGGTFFGIQIMYLIISNTSEFLITWTTVPQNVVEYKIYYSLFSFIGTIFSLALVPVWSEVTDAYHKKEIEWIKRLYFRLYKLGIIGFIGLLILMFSMQFIVNIWLGNKSVKINYQYSIIFVLSGLIFMWNAILSSFANGMGTLKISFKYMTIGAVANIPLTLLFVFITDSWIGVIIANILSMFPFCIAQTIWLDKYFERKLSY